MKIDNKIRNEKLQYDINREAAKKWIFCRWRNIAIRSKKSDRETKFTYSPLGEALEKQTKTIKDQGNKQIKAIEDHGKQLVESNAYVKKNFNIDRNSTSLEEQKKYLMKLLMKDLLNFRI